MTANTASVSSSRRSITSVKSLPAGIAATSWKTLFDPRCDTRSS
jgi:hypothetical protein